VAAKKAKKPKEKPQTEIDLDRLQDLYLQAPNDVVVFEEFFLLVKAYSRSLTLKEIKTKIFLPPDRVDEVATEATLLFFKQYLKPEWRVWGSFAGALRWKVVEALYKESFEDKMSSLNQLVGEGTQEVADVLDKIGATILYNEEGEDPADAAARNFNVASAEISGLLDEAYEALPFRLFILFECYLLLRLRRPKTRRTLPAFQEFYLDGKAEKAFDLLMLEVRNRMMPYSG
jgi:hypothetical protein